MPNIVFRFPSGRYHATPWGNHVNEGLVEWPPSPWRITRALLATGFSKLGWTEAPRAARELVEGLASALPTYRLPAASAAHTRHFMPIDSPDPEKRTKVFDAFARVGPGAELAVVWSVALTRAADALLHELVPKLSYLGRAESVVDARLVDDRAVPGGFLASASDTNRPGVEAIALLAPMSEAEYGAWRAATAPVEVPVKKGKKPKDNAFPSDALAAILADTGFLQRHGWTQPPGSRRVHFYRPVDSLSTARPRLVARPPHVANVDTALLALASDTRAGEVLPSLLRLEGHRHARIVPLCLGNVGQLDHFLIHAPLGLGAEAQRALRSIRKTYAKGGGKPIFVTLAGLGKLAAFQHLGTVDVTELGESRIWTSRTPFVPPRHLKPKRHTLEDQVQSELASRGLPAATRIDVLGREVLVARAFHRFVRARRDRQRQPPAPRFFALRIELERPTRGPIALGYASHFGLGLMVPER
jgi:CRISPR-associated protein Csb2